MTTYSKILIKGKRLILRPYRLSDFKICRASHEARLSTLDKFDAPIGIGKELNYDKFKERIGRHRKRGKMKQHFIFGLFDLRTNAYVGQDKSIF